MNEQFEIAVFDTSASYEILFDLVKSFKIARPDEEDDEDEEAEENDVLFVTHLDNRPGLFEFSRDLDSVDGLARVVDNQIWIRRGRGYDWAIEMRLREEMIGYRLGYASSSWEDVTAVNVKKRDMSGLVNVTYDQTPK